MKVDLSQLTIKKAHDLMQNGDLSARELAVFYLENIKKHDRSIHAYLEVFSAEGGSASGGDDVYEQAEKVDKKIKSGKNLPLLAGIPLAIKDNILIKDRKCSAGSKILEGFVAPYDATVIKRLKEHGAVFLGRTNMDEFAMGASTENSAFGPTKNPHDMTRVPGGSSGGSAAAVAKEMCLAALGSDTGGSIRQPAAFCGVVGFKGTYGSVSRYGLIALASSLDHIGPLTKTVEDAEIVFNAIRGKDKLDSTSVDFPPKADQPMAEKIGVPREFFSLDGENEGIDKEVAKSIKKSIDVFKNLGCKIKEISIPALDYVVETYYILMPAEASSNLARYDGVRYGLSEKGKDLLGDYIRTREKGFGNESRRRILLGTYVLSVGYYEAYYNRAQQTRNLMKQEFEKTFKEVDIILTPTTPAPAFKIGEKVKDPVKMYLEDIFTCSANLTGVPAISLPCRQAGPPCQQEGLPVGLQLMAPWFEENRLFQLGKLFEKSFKYVS